MKYVKGNLLDLAEQGKFDIVVQGCNCQNTMGSGLAKEIRERYPKAYIADQVTQKGDPDKLGCFTQSHVNGTRYEHPLQDFGFTEFEAGPDVKDCRKIAYSFTILNAYTQYAYGYDDKQYVSYDALKQAFTQIKLLYDLNPQASMRIGIPKIGAKRGGGDWNVISQIIDDIGFSDITCVEYDGE